MLRTIHLHGRLAKEFGKSHRLAVSTAGEALRALNCNFPGKFVAALQEGSFKLVRGDKRSGMHMAEVGLVNSFNLGMADLHIIPVARGAGNGKGVAKTIIGVALVGGAIFMSGGTLAAPLSGMSAAIPGGLGVTWGNVAMIGLGLTLAGVSTLLSKPTDNADQKQSFNLNGPSNVGNQGDPVQLIYGRSMVGSVNVSFDADIEDYSAYDGVTAPSSLVRPAGAY